MRQLLISVPQGRGDDVARAAGRHGGSAMASWPARSKDRNEDLVLLFLPNDRVDAALADLQAIEGHRVAFDPHGTLMLEPPADQLAPSLAEVAPRGPLEVFLAAQQSVGSWRSFLAYAAAAGVLAWVGLYTDTIFLLTAAMLVAPFASPAMNLAIATARGDGSLMLRSLARYVAGVGVAVAVAALLSWLAGLDAAGPQLRAVANVSATAVLLPLVAGVAGALSQVQSERASLVSGAAVGMLVAASLAPPAALVGMAAVLGDGPMVQAGAFLLALQLAGINLTGALVFRRHGLGPRGVRYQAGRPWVSAVGAAVSVAVLAGLLAWQFSSPVALTQASSAQRALPLVRQAVAGAGVAELVEARASFPRTTAEGKPVLLIELVVLRRGAGPSARIQERLARAVAGRFDTPAWNVTPLVEVSVLEPPP